MNKELEIIQAEINFLELRLELLKKQREDLKEKVGDTDYSDHPYLPK